MSAIKTSGGANPKPGTLIKVNQRGSSEYVLIGGYRIKQVRNGWHLYIAKGDGWGKARWFGTKQRAVDAMTEHMLTGGITQQQAPLVHRVAELEREIAALRAAVQACPSISRERA